MANQDYIGRALEYPLRVANGSALVTTGNTVIINSIRRILGIQRGELPVNPSFGSRLGELVFEQNNVVAISTAKTFIKDAVRTWERRIELVSVEGQVGEDNSTIFFNISFKVLGSNQKDSFVYPFYRELKF